jgi:hypothetical protein
MAPVELLEDEPETNTPSYAASFPHEAGLSGERRISVTRAHLPMFPDVQYTEEE